MRRDGYRSIFDVTAAPDTSPLQASHVRVSQYLPDLHSETGTNPTQCLEREVTFTALKRAVVRAMHSDLVRESLLRHLKGFSTFTKCLTDPFRDRCVFHDGEPYGRASCSSTILKID